MVPPPFPTTIELLAFVFAAGGIGGRERAERALSPPPAGLRWATGALLFVGVVLAAWALYVRSQCWFPDGAFC